MAGKTGLEPANSIAFQQFTNFKPTFTYLNSKARITRGAKLTLSPRCLFIDLKPGFLMWRCAPFLSLTPYRGIFLIGAVLFTTAVLTQTITCPCCQLSQFPWKTGQCRRCHKPTGVSYVAINVPRDAATSSDASITQVRPLIGRPLLAMRSRRGLYHELLSRYSRASSSLVSGFERKSTCPSLPTLLRIAATLGIDQLVIQTRDTNQNS